MAVDPGARAFGAELSNAGAPAESTALAKTPAAAKAFSSKSLELAFEKIGAQNTNKLGEWEICAKGLEALHEPVHFSFLSSPLYQPLSSSPRRRQRIQRHLQAHERRLRLVVLG